MVHEPHSSPEHPTSFRRAKVWNLQCIKVDIHLRDFTNYITCCSGGEVFSRYNLIYVNLSLNPDPSAPILIYMYLNLHYTMIQHLFNWWRRINLRQSSDSYCGPVLTPGITISWNFKLHSIRMLSYEFCGHYFGSLFFGTYF